MDASSRDNWLDNEAESEVSTYFDVIDSGLYSRERSQLDFLSFSLYSTDNEDNAMADDDENQPCSSRTTRNLRQKAPSVSWVPLNSMFTEAIREILSESIDNNRLNEPARTLNKENLTSLIKETLKEGFAKQEKNISNLINGNFEITMKEIRKSQGEIKDLRKEITEFKESLQFTENELHGKIKKLEEKHESIKKTVDGIYNSQVDSDFVYDKLIDLEDRSR